TKGFSCKVAAACTIPVDLTTIGLDSGGSSVGQFKNPSFLAVDPNDVVYVADYANQRIQRFAPDGTFAGQAQSTGNGVNAATDGSFVLGNMGPPKHVTVNSKNFFVVDQSEHFVHVFDTSPFKDVTDSSATVSYVSKFDFHSATDTFAYAVNDGLVDSNSGIVSVAVARNYRQPLPTQQEIALDEDNTQVIVLSGADPDGILTRDFNGLDSLTFKIAKQPKHGKLVHGGNAGGATLDPGTDVWTYTPNRDYHGADSFEFTVRDAFTDATVGDDGTAIPEPYGEATPAAVGIVVNSVNDIPIVRISAPKRIAAGFPVLLQASAYDDTGDNYAATLIWGDGAIDRDGKVVVDQHGTPNDTSDDTTALTGVVYSADGLSASGQTQMNAMHTYTATGNRKLTLCLRDGGYLEACDTITVAVESLVTLGTKVEVSEAKIADGIPFTSKITVADSAPTGGVPGLDASDVHLTMELPQELRVNQISPSQGSCAVDQGVLKCSLGTLTNGASATINLVLRGAGTLIHDSDLSLLAAVTTASEAIDDDSVGSATVSLKAVPNDRDANGLPNIFEAVYGVSDPSADDDGDGLGNRAELDAGTSPRNADSDGDGIPDGAEVNVYHTDPLSADSDRDGVSDFDEIRVHRTNPLASDTDGDGLPDQWEVDHGFNPLVADGGGDADHDGLSDADEVRYGTDYLSADSDGDGLRDGDEVHAYGTNPAVKDTDTDGLDDGAELTAGTDPLKPDSDDDGLLDGEEINLYATNPLRADTDRDGLPDGWEVRHARNPLVADYALAAGGLSTCALTDGGVQCWGRNDAGQAPALVAGLVHPEQITVGYAHACAIDRAPNGARSVKCWGDNTYGQ
ncbi:MAG TPA: Ig-like domain-containing protein, partial [Gammaproteobacteria bacterium]|nr:Ig-like domain-containing protein [Gammaproteobacteria bacterium]